MALFLYQGLAEPTPRAASLPETPHADVWGNCYPDYIRPVPRLVDRDCYDGDAKNLTTPERTSVDKWEHFYPDWLRPIPRLTDRDCLDFGEGVFTAESVTADRWAHWYPDYLRPTPRLADRDCYDSDPKNLTAHQTVGVDSWEHFYPDWLRPVPRLTDRESYDFTERFFPESVTLDKWYYRHPDPPAPAKRLTDRDQGPNNFWQNFVGVFNPGTGFPHPTPEPPPKPLKREVNNDGWFTVDTKVLTVKEAVTADRWVHEYPDYLRPTARHVNQEGLSFVTVVVSGINPAAGFPWQPIEPPPRSPQRVTTVSGWFAIDTKSLTAKESVTVDRWEHFYPDYLRPVPRLTDRECLSLSQRYFPDLGYPWVVQEPPPRQPRRLTPQEWTAYGEGVFVQPVVNVDSWSHFYVDWLRPVPRLTDRECTNYFNFAILIGPGGEVLARFTGATPVEAEFDVGPAVLARFRVKEAVDG